jgi:signal transduction histidine kinase
MREGHLDERKRSEGAIDCQAVREFVQARLGQQRQRLIFFAVTLAAALVFVPWGWVAGTATALLATELLERRASRAVLAAGGCGGRDWRAFVAANLATASATGLLIVVLWVHDDPGNNLFALAVLFITTFYVALAYPQVPSLLMARQGLYAGLTLALAGRDLALAETPSAAAVVTKCLPVVALAAYVIGLSRWSASSYRLRLEHAHGLAEARDAAEQARAAKASLIATISHELRTPLNGIIGMAQTLLAARLAPELRRQVEVIAESGRNLNALLSDILDLSKLEAGRLAITPAEDDLRQTVRHVEQLYRPVAEEKRLAFSVAVDPSLPPRLSFDSVRVRQCLSNLVSNALKFTEAGSVAVRVTAEPAAGGPARWRVTMTVTDTGIGIPRAQQAGLFQPFAQADGTIARRFGGTGLGLSISRHLAEAMGGDVTVESQPGKGSTFRLTFLADAAPAGAREGEAATAAAAPRVLVADDVETNRVMLRLFLKPLGVEIVEAADGHAAIDALVGARLDAAFLDLNMPGMAGAELAARVRRGEAGRPDLPLVAIAADGQAAPEPDGVGFDGAVGKPFDPEQVRAALARALAPRLGHGPGEGAVTR